MVTSPHDSLEDREHRPVSRSSTISREAPRPVRAEPCEVEGVGRGRVLARVGEAVAMSPPVKQQRDELTLRVPPTLKQRLAEAAQENGRSLNAEIVHRLRVSVDGYRR